MWVHTYENEIALNYKKSTLAFASHLQDSVKY